MEKPNKNHGAKSERTLLTALLFSLPGPFITIIAAISSRSATQIADFLRRSAELVASFVSWLVFHKLQRRPTSEDDYRIRLERIANMTVAWAMLCSGAALLVVGVMRLLSNSASGKSVMGLVIALLGLTVNTLFWLRYKRLTKEQYSSVLAAQQRLYRAKAVVDFCVTAALAAVVIAPTHPATKYIDALGSVTVAVYLLMNGISIMGNIKSTVKA